MSDDREQRILDLSTGFTLGELGDEELRELYDFLREPGEGGQAAGQLAWEALGMCIDLRSQMGESFQDTLFMKLSESGDDGSVAFAAKVRSRLGHSRPKLKPVEPSALPPKRSWVGVIIAVAITIAVVGATTPIWLHRSEPSVATLTAIVGNVAQEGGSLHANQGIDRRQIIIGPASQIALQWADGSHAVIAGPAACVAGKEGLSLLSGRAWCTSVQLFSIGLPDRPEPVILMPNTRVALDIRDNRTMLALDQGSITGSRMSLTPQQAVDVSAPTTPYPWREEALPRGVGLEPGSSQARWTVDGVIHFREMEAAVVMRFQLADDHTAELFLAPGSAALRLDGRELQRLVLSGAPLAERELRVQANGNILQLTIGAQKLETPLPYAVSRVGWDGDAGELQNALLRSGPARHPPFATTLW